MTDSRPPKQTTLLVAVVLSLVGGIWMIVVAGGMGMGYGWQVAGQMPGAGGPGTWMWHSSGMGQMAGWGRYPWIGVLCGVVAAVTAGVLYARPRARVACGGIIVVASTIGLLAGMGGFVPGVLGIIGGALAMVPRMAPPS